MSAHYLHACGLFLGDTLLGANDSNPYGHFEDREAMAIHDDILTANMTNWMLDHRISPFVPDDIWHRMQAFVEKRQIAHVTWGFKDPRVCHFLSLWKSMIPDAKVLIVYRNPIECVRSLNKRHAQDYARANKGSRSPFYSEPDLALKIWTISNSLLVDHAEKNLDDVLIVNHRTLANGVFLSKLINDKWGFDLETRNTRENYDPELGMPASRPLRVADPENGKLASLVWDRLMKLEHETAGAGNGAAGADIRFSHDGDYGKILMENELLQFENAFVRKRLHEARQSENRIRETRHEHDLKLQEYDLKLHDCERALEEARHAHREILDSTFWKLSGPLRSVVDRVRGRSAKDGR